MSLSFSSRLSRATRGWFAGTVLDSHAEPYVAWLEARGYAPGTIDRYLRAVAHFAHWSAPRLNAIGESTRSWSVASLTTICPNADARRAAFGRERMSAQHWSSCSPSSGPKD